MSSTQNKKSRWGAAVEKNAIMGALQHLKDIRQTHADNHTRQSHLLIRSHPAIYNASTVRQKLLLEGSNEKVAEDVRAIDLSLVLGRYLQTYVVPDYRKYPDPQSPQPELRQIFEDEQSCLLAELMWKDYEFQNDTKSGRNRSKRAQSFLRWCAAKEIAKSLGYDRVEDLQFLVVMESGLMRQALWKRPPFLLRAPFYHTRPIDSPSTTWKRVDADDQHLKNFALVSLIRWDGVRDLQDIIRKKLDISQQGNQQIGYETNRMAVVRIWHQPTAETTPRGPSARELDLDFELADQPVSDCQEDEDENQ